MNDSLKSIINVYIFSLFIINVIGKTDFQGYFESIQADTTFKLLLKHFCFVFIECCVCFIGYGKGTYE